MCVCLPLLVSLAKNLTFNVSSIAMQCPFMICDLLVNILLFLGLGAEFSFHYLNSIYSLYRSLPCLEICLKTLSLGIYAASHLIHWLCIGLRWLLWPATSLSICKHDDTLNSGNLLEMR